MFWPFESNSFAKVLGKATKRNCRGGVRADYLGLTSVATRWRTDTYGNLCHGNRYKLCCLCMREKVWIIGCEDLRQPFCLL